MFPYIIVYSAFAAAFTTTPPATPLPLAGPAARMAALTTRMAGMNRDVNATLDRILATTDKSIAHHDRHLAGLKADGIPETSSLYQYVLSLRQKDAEFRRQMASTRLK